MDAGLTDLSFSGKAEGGTDYFPRARLTGAQVVPSRDPSRDVRDPRGHWERKHFISFLRASGKPRSKLFFTPTGWLLTREQMNLP